MIRKKRAAGKTRLAITISLAGLVACGGGGSDDPQPTPTPTPTTKSWTLNVGGEVKTITENTAFAIGQIQLCQIVTRGGVWNLSLIQGCGSTGSSYSTYSQAGLHVAQLAGGTATFWGGTVAVCPVSEQEYQLTLQAQDQNSLVTYSFTKFPQGFDFSAGTTYHVAALTDDGTGNGTLTIASGACPQ